MNETIQHIWIEAEEWASGEWNPGDGNTDVKVTLGDGSTWVATFLSYKNISSLVEKNRKTGECLSGRYFWASNMILADRVSRERIEEIVTYLVKHEPLEFQSMLGFTRRSSRRCWRVADVSTEDELPGKKDKTHEFRLRQEKSVLLLQL